MKQFLILTIPFFLGVCLSSLAGVVTPNTKFITDAHFELSSVHPQQDRILKLINGKTLPVRLQEALLNDLAKTSIIYSSERYTYKELIEAANKNMSLKKLIKRYKKGENEIEEEWQPSVDGRRYGLYARSYADIKFSKKKDSPLAAFTMTNNPKQVIYFSKVINQLSRHEQIKLVLHEQAHRLKSIFGERAKDEVFVDAWAEALYKYLRGKLNRKSFYQLLKRNKIETHSAADTGVLCAKIKCFPNERRISDGSYIATIPIVLSPDDLLYYDSDRLILNSRVFSQYPPLIEGPEKVIHLDTPSLRQHDPHETLKKTVDEFKRGNREAILPIEVPFTRHLIEGLNGRHRYEYTINRKLTLINNFEQTVRAAWNKGFCYRNFHTGWSNPLDQLFPQKMAIKLQALKFFIETLEKVSSDLRDRYWYLFENMSCSYSEFTSDLQVYEKHNKHHLLFPGLALENYEKAITLGLERALVDIPEISLEKWRKRNYFKYIGSHSKEWTEFLLLKEPGKKVLTLLNTFGEEFERLSGEKLNFKLHTRNKFEFSYKFHLNLNIELIVPLALFDGHEEEIFTAMSKVIFNRHRLLKKTWSKYCHLNGQAPIHIDKFRYKVSRFSTGYCITKKHRVYNKTDEYVPIFDEALRATYEKLKVLGIEVK